MFEQQAKLDILAARGLLNDEEYEEHEEAKRERRADRIDERQEAEEEFDFERDCGARP